MLLVLGERLCNRGRNGTHCHNTGGGAPSRIRNISCSSEPPGLAVHVVLEFRSCTVECNGGVRQMASCAMSQHTPSGGPRSKCLNRRWWNQL